MLKPFDCNVHYRGILHFPPLDISNGSPLHLPHFHSGWWINDRQLHYVSWYSLSRGYFEHKTVYIMAIFFSAIFWCHIVFSHLALCIFFRVSVPNKSECKRSHCDSCETWILGKIIMHISAAYLFSNAYSRKASVETSDETFSFLHPVSHRHRAAKYDKIKEVASLFFSFRLEIIEMKSRQGSENTWVILATKRTEQNQEKYIYSPH